MQQDDDNTVCGYVAIVGRPNVGKSTLLNHLLGEKLSITSRKPQTTRHRVLGVKTTGLLQTIYVDTPGIHQVESHLLNEWMNKEAKKTLTDVDVIVFVVDSFKWTEGDEFVFNLVKNARCPVILVINKIDLVPDKKLLLPYCEALEKRGVFKNIIPLSAKREVSIDTLESVIAKYLPKSPHYFPADQKTSQTPRFRVAEIIREKLIRLLGAELPYATTVEIAAYKPGINQRMPEIHAIIWVEREGQKPIVIGENGERLKKIGIKARADIEHMMKKQVVLKLWVKVRRGWSNDERALKSLGYGDFE